jgi:hypothetical protein
VVRPGGFWGYRHAIGWPLTVGGIDAPASLLDDDAELELTFGVATSLALREDHRNAVEALRKRWTDAETRGQLFKRLAAVNPHLVYLYCHGGVAADGSPYLEVGPPDGDYITRGYLTDRIYWTGPQPIVFIKLEPEQAIDFVSGFVENANAAGVIGTESTVFEEMATVFGIECLRDFLLEGRPIGESARRARLALLQQDNPLGLAYVPFVIPTIALKAAGTTLTPPAARVSVA